MTFNQLVIQITLKFLEAWNVGDFEAIESQLAADIVFESPNISKLITENKSNKVIGRKQTVDYLKLFAVQFPDFKFDNKLTEVIKEDRLIVMKGFIANLNKYLVGRYYLDEYGKFQLIQISYTD